MKTPTLAAGLSAFSPLVGAPLSTHQFAITQWPSLKQAYGGVTSRYTWDGFRELHEAWAHRRIAPADKDHVPVYSPVASTDGRRRGASAYAIHMLILDHDEGTPWHELAELLRHVGVAHLLHESRSHTPERPRWRVAFPLTPVPVPDEPARAAWLRAYRQFARNLGNAVDVKFDPATADAGRLWHFGVPVGDVPPRRVYAQGGFTLDGPRLLRLGHLAVVRTAKRAKAAGKPSGRPPEIPAAERKLPALFKAAGVAGEQRGNRLFVACPWAHEHSKQDERIAGDTVVFLAEDHFYCSHAHCRSRDKASVMKRLRGETR